MTATERPEGAGSWLEGRTSGVLGLGVTGQAAVRALVAAGAPPALLADSGDDAAATARAGIAAALAPEADLRLGAGPADLADLDVLIVSPGVPRHHPLLVAAQSRGTEIVAEVEAAWRLSGGATRLIGVTGTNGKTTVTRRISALMDAPAAGNIGTALSGVIAVADPPAWCVAELSSFQLRFTSELTCEVGVVCNVAPDHLDWHGDAVDYRGAKARVWAHSQTAVIGDDAGAEALAVEHPPAGRLIAARTGPPGDGEVGVADGTIVDRTGGTATVVADLGDLGGDPAPHTVANAVVAVAAARAAGAPVDGMAPRLAAFQAGPHRMAVVATTDGVTWIDDSKATNPHAAGAALASARRIIWICGGLAKGLDPGGLAPLVADRVDHVLTIGTSAPAFEALAGSVGVPAEGCTTLDVAVSRAAQIAEPGQTVLLSPACASMDQFSDYAERGRAFAALVPRHARPGATP